jgi:hypothetical protein
MLARLLPDGAVVLPKDMLASEILERIERDCRGTVIVSAMPPSAASNAAYVAKRLHARFPHRRIVIALWTARGNLERIASRLKDSGAADVLTTFSDAISQARLAPRVG